MGSTNKSGPASDRARRTITLAEAKLALDRARKSDGTLMSPYDVIIYLYDEREMSSGIDSDCCGVLNAFVGSTFNTKLIEQSFDREQADLIAAWMLLAADEVEEIEAARQPSS